VNGNPASRRRTVGSCVCPNCGGAGTVANAPPAIAWFNGRHIPNVPGIMLGYLMLHPGRLVRAGELMAAIWGDSDDPPSDKILSVYVMQLRRLFAGSAATLDTVWGRGWIFRAPAELIAAALDDPKNGGQGNGGQGNGAAGALSYLPASRVAS
jgi:hypothetical protein